jgi:ATP-binding cassette, subfamily B, bacterial MsbA
MKRLFPYLRFLKPVRKEFVAAVFYGILFGVSSGLGLPFLLQKVFPVVFADGPKNLTTLELLSFASLLPSVFLIRGIAGFRNSYLISLCGVRVLEQIRMLFFEKLQRLPLSFFSKSQSGDLLARGLGDANQLQITITTVANEVIKQPATLVSALGALIYLSIQNHDVVFVLLCLALVPASVFPIRMVGKNLLKRARQMQDQSGGVVSIFSENLTATKEIRAFGLESREITRLRDALNRLIVIQLKVVKYSNILSPSIEFMSTLGVSAALIYAYHARLPWEVFFAMVGALYMSYDPIKKMGALNNEMKRGLSSLDRLEEVLDAPIEIMDPPRPVAVDRLTGDIKFREVSFAYKTGIPVLRDVNINIPAGTVCALVGPSGAGKSTFANMVPRFYEALDGSVLIDGIDVRAMRVADLRRNIALVSQDPVLFDDTIYNNLLLGRMNATRAEVEQAARDAFAHDFILSQPQGYDTIVGERGGKLSGGQKQRVALARAFLRNAPILILDEATSALDSESEASIQQALQKLMAGKTVLIIAHRFSTIRDASMILVFEQGRIVAGGSHQDLYGSSALYKSLYNLQHGGALETKALSP